MSRGDDELRVSDVDRERVTAELKQHCADGRITLEEFSERLTDAYTARTYDDLRSVLRDLPVDRNSPVVDSRAAPKPPKSKAVAGAVQEAQAHLPHLPHQRRFVSGYMKVYLRVNLMLIVIWLLTSGPSSYFWPMWPMFGMAVPLLFGAWKPGHEHPPAQALPRGGHAQPVAGPTWKSLDQL